MATYTIQWGDTLTSIAKANNTTIDALLSANPNITNPNLIYAGALLNLPGTTTTPTTPGTDPNAGGGAPSTPPPPVPGTGTTPNPPPNWNAGSLPATWTANTEYAAFTNAVLPYLSAEDQRTFAGNLARLFPEQYAGMNPVTAQYPLPGTKITTDERRYYQSAERAQAIMSTLQAKAAQSGQTNFGPGYAFLQQIVAVIRDYGANSGNGQTRRQQLQMLSALDPLMAESKSESLAAYAPLAQALTTPFSSAGQIRPVQKDANGNWIFGAYNSELVR